MHLACRLVSSLHLGKAAYVALLDWTVAGQSSMELAPFLNMSFTISLVDIGSRVSPSSNNCIAWSLVQADLEWVASGIFLRQTHLSTSRLYEAPMVQILINNAATADSCYRTQAVNRYSLLHFAASHYYSADLLAAKVLR